MSTTPPARRPVCLAFLAATLLILAADAEADEPVYPLRVSADKVVVEPQYTLAQAGLLTPDQRYYWRVRAMDDQGVWGPWSRIWSFTPRGPGHPLNVALDFDAAKATGTLRWTANPTGRRPVKYRVYGSDEKGFTIADQPYQGTVGVTKVEMAAWNPWFPANFIAETAFTELTVVGGEVELPAAQFPWVTAGGGCSAATAAKRSRPDASW